jgi:hypothetical protein
MAFTHIPKYAWTVQQLASAHIALFGRDVGVEVFVYNLASSAARAARAEFRVAGRGA